MTKTYRDILAEGTESKNMRAAKHYIYNKLGRNDEPYAMQLIGSIKHDIPNSRLAKCKFMLGIVRMFMDNELTDAQTILKLNQTLKYIATDAHVNEYNQDLNGTHAYDIINRFSKSVTDDLEAEKKQLSSQAYMRNPDYEIVKINSFSEAEEYGNYTDWCVTQYESNYDTYTYGGFGVFYFCLKKGFENVECIEGENCPLDEYGLSMIAVSVNQDGSCNTITCRWNHDNGGNDNIMSVKELSELLGGNFYELFPPRTKEELQAKKEELNADLKVQLQYGEAERIQVLSGYNIEGEYQGGVWVIRGPRPGNYDGYDQGYYLMDENDNLLSSMCFDEIQDRIGDFVTVEIHGNVKILNIASDEFVKLPNGAYPIAFSLNGHDVLIKLTGRDRKNTLWDTNGRQLLNKQYISFSIPQSIRGNHLFAFGGGTNNLRGNIQLEIYDEDLHPVFDKLISYMYSPSEHPFIFFKFEGENAIYAYDDKTMKRLSNVPFSELLGYYKLGYMVKRADTGEKIMINSKLDVFNNDGQPLGKLTELQPVTNESKTHAIFSIIREELDKFLSEEIHIKKSHEGKFTQWLKNHPKETVETAKHNKSAAVRKMANFAANIGKTSGRKPIKNKSLN